MPTHQVGLIGRVLIAVCGAFVLLISACVGPAEDSFIEVEGVVQNVAFQSMHGADGKVIPVGVATLLLSSPEKMAGASLRVNLISERTVNEENPFSLGRTLRFKMGATVKSGDEVSEFALKDIVTVKSAQSAGGS